MPIITVRAIKGVVLTSDAQKRELLRKMTDAFIEVVGEVARPYTYCIIEETPLYEWAIAGESMPNQRFLYGSEYAEMHRRANELMRAYVEQSAGQSQVAPAPAPDGAATAGPVGDATRAERVWRGEDGP